MSRLEPRTSLPDRSIWLHLPEDTFRQHLVTLEKRTNAVPVDPQIFPLISPNTAPSTHTLPLHTEQQLADDLAFLAAIEEGAQSVAAVCLEEHTSLRRLTIRFAALDLSLSEEIKTALHQIVDILVIHDEDDASALTKSYEGLFERIVTLHRRRLLARLRSAKWAKPTYLRKQHKKPLYADFANLVHRVQFLYLKKEYTLRRSVENHIGALCAVYKAFETLNTGSPIELLALQDLVKASYEFCINGEVAEFADRLEGSVKGTPTRQVASAIKCLRQIEKIGAYWRIARSLIDTSRSYPSLFRRRVELAFLTPYKSVPTAIGYEAWATSCHVHAEVQLAVYYDLLEQTYKSEPDAPPASSSASSGELSDVLRPRVIGTSKWLCYLCYLFLRAHGRFVPANTHGRLYDQWTVPDLDEFGEQLCARYRDIVHNIDEEVVRETSASDPEEPVGEGSMRWRAEPMTSRQNLLGGDSSGTPTKKGGNTDHAGKTTSDMSAKLVSLDLNN